VAHADRAERRPIVISDQTAFAHVDAIGPATI